MRAPGTAYDDDRLGGKDPQPAHFDGYVETSDDDGGVHINSGIPNRAFYLAAVDLGGGSWERAGRIWYATLQDDALEPDSTFAAFAALTVANAARLYDDGVAATVRGGWEQVGVDAG
jgi:Zn-dependent metalloprotease